MRSTALALVACMLTGPALAEEPAGCDKFKWPIETERSLLTGKTIANVASGANVAWALPVAANVTLVPFADAKLPAAPERTPKLANSFAGYLQVAAPAKVGTYKITLSAEAWVDVVQDGRLVKSQGFSGAPGCEGVRKSVKFPLQAQPFTVQFSNVQGNAIAVAISSD